MLTSDAFVNHEVDFKGLYVSKERSSLNITVRGLELIYLHKLAKPNWEGETVCLKPCFPLIGEALNLPL